MLLDLGCYGEGEHDFIVASLVYLVAFGAQINTYLRLPLLFEHIRCRGRFQGNILGVYALHRELLFWLFLGACC